MDWQAGPQAEVMVCMSLAELAPPALSAVCAFLPAADAAVAACACRALRAAVRDEQAWEARCKAELQLRERGAAGSWQAAYVEVAQGAAAREGGVAATVHARGLVAALRDWCAQHAPEIGASLRAGLSENEIQLDEEAHSQRLPAALYHLYRAVGGQQLLWDDEVVAPQMRHEEPGAVEPHPSVLQGVFGSYAVYDHVVSTRLLTLPLARRVTRFLVSQGALPRELVGEDIDDPRCLVFAASFNLQKMFAVSLDTGDVLVNTRQPNRPWLSAAPPVGNGALTLLGWLENYVQKLCVDYLAAQKMDTADFFGPELGVVTVISLFPEGGPSSSEATSEGVRVRCGALFMPEVSQQGDMHLFSYRLRMAIAEGCEKTVQLRSRRWKFTDDGSPAQDQTASGPGVIGKYPILRPGLERDFEYCSQCSLRGFSG